MPIKNWSRIRKVKVNLLLGQNPFFSSSAGWNRALTLIEGLRDLGCDIELIFVIGYHSLDEKERLGKSGMYKGISYKYFHAFVRNTLWKWRVYNYLLKYFYDYSTGIKVNRYLIKNKAILWPASGLFIWRLVYGFKKKNLDYPLFIEISEFLDIHHYNNSHFIHRRIGDAASSFFVKKLFQLTNGMALMTNTLLAHFAQMPGQKPQMIHLPMIVDLRRFTGQPKCLEGFSKPYIVFVGVMNDAKDGVSILIKSFNKIKAIYPNYKAYLVGGWNYDTPSHLELIKEYSLEERVFWMKEYPRDQIPNIICNADLLALPRPDSKQAQGGFPTKLGEYLATGNPVCATTVGEIPDYLTDNESVFFAEPGSVESFAEAMDIALSNTENARCVGDNGRKVAEREFNKNVQAKMLYDFLYSF